jgi:hypothetical protein
MNLTALWDVHTLIYVILSAIVILVILGLLSTTNRQLRMLASEVESIRREMKLVDEGVRSVAQHLHAQGGSSREDGVVQVSSEAKTETAPTEQQKSSATG